MSFPTSIVSIAGSLFSQAVVSYNETSSREPDGEITNIKQSDIIIFYEGGNYVFLFKLKTGMLIDVDRQ